MSMGDDDRAVPRPGRRLGPRRPADRLARTRFPDRYRGIGWEAGMPIDYLRQLVDYWSDTYDWRAEEAGSMASTLPYPDRRPVDPLPPRPVPPPRGPPPDHHPRLARFGRRVPRPHPAADRPDGPRGRAEDAFHVIAPSLPGYGFSEPPGPGAGTWPRIARAFIALMDRLGYPRYGAQGGDWGAQVDHPDRRPRPGALCRHPPQHAGRIAAGGSRGAHRRRAGRIWPTWAAFQGQEAAYATEQGTKPQTIGAALNDSPAGLLAWIIEKFRTWSDCDGRSGTLLLEGPAPHQRHAVLADPDRRLLGPALLGDEPERGADGEGALHQRAHRGGPLPEGGAPLAAVVGGGAVQRHPLGGHAPGRSLRRPWSSPSCSPTTSRRSSERCADPWSGTGVRRDTSGPGSAGGYVRRIPLRLR